jgi:hypothetical protein
VRRGLFRIVDGTSFMDKGRDDTSVQKLIEVHINTSKNLIKKKIEKKK